MKNKIKSSSKKSRKDLRKAKRNEKKVNKKIYFSKTVDHNKLKNKNSDIKSNIAVRKNKDQTESDGSDPQECGVQMSKKVSLKKATPIKKLEVGELDESKFVDRYQENRKREIKKQKELERKTRKQRLVQLKEANENEDKIIRKLEKRLKIEKHRNQKSVHKMFSDGLDYALELCLPENIEKMYSAAKEVARFEDASNDEDDFHEDFAAALGNNQPTNQIPNCENVGLPKKVKKNSGIEKTEVFKKNDKHVKSLKHAEQKYFLDSDFNEMDSEIESQNEDCSDEFSSESDEQSEDEVEFVTENGQEIKTDEECKIAEFDMSDEIFPDDLNKLPSVPLNVSNILRLEDKIDSKDKMDSEDIYGRKLDAEGNLIQSNSQKYISPHLRARLDVEGSGNDSKYEVKLDRLRKQVKGLVNRLSEANMHKISSEVEQLFMSNSRFDMNNTLSEIILDALVNRILSKERMVLEYTLLIAILHGNVGTEVGAHFLQILITKFAYYLKIIDTLDIQNKELDNIILILSHLYTYNVFQHSLVFEIMKRLSSKLSEKSIECILLILKSVGFQLRKDDPSELKEFILSIQVQANDCSFDIKENTRYKFMIEILNAIKNNNMMKIPNYDPSLAAHLKKILKSFFSNGKYLSTLNITIEDLLDADKKGKWWVVGSAWSGNVNDIGSAKLNDIKSSEKFSDKLLDLARKQRMNTEDRRNTFCVIMSAEDYVDAFERLLNLSLKDNRIISSIIIHCCLSERSFNPYYAALAKKFCEHDRKYQLAIQFACWDRIKDINSLNKLQMKNLGRFITFLIIQGAQPISVLKVIEFTELDKVTLRFVRQIILAILLGDEMECQHVFERIAPSFKLNNFKDSLRLFMNHFLLKGSNENQTPKDQINLLKERINFVDNILAYSNSKLKF